MSLRRRPRSSPPSSGFTLVEVVVVLALLALGVALTAPALTPVRPTEQSLGHLVRAARDAAIARAQPLELAVDAVGRWTLAPPGSAATLASGALGEATPADSLRLALAPTGSCALRTPLPASWTRWDAARCAATPPLP